MQKRGVILGAYDTALEGWTLSACMLGEALQKTNDVDIPGADGALDLSTVTSDGIPRFHSRELYITLERSDGTRESRNAEISLLINQLQGMTVPIGLPDYPDHYLTGRLHIRKEYSDMAHAAVTVTATCGPWLEEYAETVVTLTAAATEKTATLANNGRRVVVPRVTITGGPITLIYGGASWALTAGTYAMPEILLTPGRHSLTYKGTGKAVIAYREAVLE